MNGQGASSYQAKFQRAGSGFTDMITFETVEEFEWRQDIKKLPESEFVQVPSPTIMADHSIYPTYN